MPKPNIDLLKRLRTRFLRMRHAEHFNMSTWVEKNECGTAMCIAGHALDLQGYRVRTDEFGNSYFVSPSTGKRVNPRNAAQRELGLSHGVVSGCSRNSWSGLFFDSGIRTPKDAAKRIERVINEGL